MRFIETKIHAVLDYVVAIVLGSIPWLLNFAHFGPGTGLLPFAKADEGISTQKPG